MGCCLCFLVAAGIITLIVAYILKKIHSIFYAVPEVPKVDENLYWGRGEADSEKEDASIVPFEIKVSDEVLVDLKHRLSTARGFTPSLESVQHQYGINTKLLSEIKDFWQNKYDWRERENFLNQYSQYKTKIQGLDIHFLHVKPTETDGLKVIPLLCLHGWPGSVREFYEAIPRFTKPSPGRNFVFEAIVPSLPGYGFSDGAARPGLNPLQIAVIMKNLMVRLKFDRWYVQGGDWGTVIGTSLAIVYPNHILGFHFNNSIAQTPLGTLKQLLGALCPSFIVSSKHKSKLYPLTNLFKKIMDEMGYMHLQATRPDTVGVALNDSPIGLAAYIIEKFISWTNLQYTSREDGGLLLKFDYTKLLDNVMIYWISNSITTSSRLYAEGISKTHTVFEMAKIPVRVPCAFVQFEHEFSYANKTLLKDKFVHLLQTSEVETGGHFVAFEEPVLFANDVWDAVEKFENYHKKQY